MSSIKSGQFRHVKWDDLPEEEARPGVHRKAVASEDVMLVMNECKPGMQVNPHSHGFAQVALFLQGRGILHIDGVEHLVEAGSVVVIPPGVEHYIEPIGDEPVLNMDVFAPPRADYMHLVEWMND